MKRLAWFTPIALTLVCLQASAAERVIGDWYGILATGAGGDLTLIVTVSKNGDAWDAVLESPDQAPGQKIPINKITVTDERIAFAIDIINASYEGEWVEAEQHWSGFWTQGGRAPLTFSKTPPPAKTQAAVTGLDGVWNGSLNRDGTDLRLVLYIDTADQGTVVKLDSPDLMAYGLSVSEFLRDANVVSFAVPISGVQYKGTLTDEGTQMSGAWTLPGRPEAQVTFVRAGE